MGKTRKCRLTDDELKIHEEAVKLRKMTDEQLVQAFGIANTSEDAPKSVKEASGRIRAKNNTDGVKKLLTALSEGKCRGIASATVYKLTQFAREMGLI